MVGFFSVCENRRRGGCAKGRKSSVRSEKYENNELQNQPPKNNVFESENLWRIHIHLRCAPRSLSISPLLSRPNYGALN